MADPAAITTAVKAAAALAGDERTRTVLGAVITAVFLPVILVVENETVQNLEEASQESAEGETAGRPRRGRINTESSAEASVRRQYRRRQQTGAEQSAAEIQEEISAESGVEPEEVFEEVFEENQGMSMGM